MAQRRSALQRGQLSQDVQGATGPRLHHIPPARSPLPLLIACMLTLSQAPPALGKGRGAPWRCSFSGPSKYLFVFQAVRFSCQGSKSSCLRWRIGQKRSHLGPHKCPHSLQWAKQGQQAAINASLTRASKPARAEPQSDHCAAQLGAHERTWRTDWLGRQPPGRDRGWVSSPTPSVCGREITARNELPGILIMTGFAFTPQKKLLGPRQ